MALRTRGWPLVSKSTSREHYVLDLAARIRFLLRIGTVVTCLYSRLSEAPVCTCFAIVVACSEQAHLPNSTCADMSPSNLPYPGG